MKIVIAISGASGAIYASILIEKLQSMGEKCISEMGIIMSDNAKAVWQWELGNKNYENIGITLWKRDDFMAPFASGSAAWDALVICPCSMGVIGRIAAGVSDDLTSRAADVMLKEGRKLICVVRESPYSAIHLTNMLTITQSGGIIVPASPSFYQQPKNIEEAVSSIVDRVIQILGIDHTTFRWGS